jgi:exosortase/archaeosortase
MLTLIALIALGSSAWAVFDLACAIRADRRITVADSMVMTACVSCFLCAAFTLGVLWLG